jgi:hypothetical protein
VNRWRVRIGHRGAVCALLGIIWCFIAAGLILSPPRHVGLIYERMPIHARAALWAIPGLIGLAAAFARRLRDHAWWILIIPPAERAASFGWAFIGAPLGLATTVPNAWLGLGVYGALCILVYECAAGLDRPLERLEVGGWRPTP